MTARGSTDERTQRVLLGARAPAAAPRAARLATLLLSALLALTLVLAPRAEAFVYWANAPSTETGGGRIGRANLDGTGVNQSFITGAGVAFGPPGVAVDAAHVYWADFARGTIGRANLDGTGVNQSFITGAGTDFCLGGVAVDAGHVYWANGCAPGTIGRANLDGTGVDNRFITVATNIAAAVAVDAAHVYWGDFDRGTIGRANLDGTGVDQSFITGTGAGTDCLVGVAVDAGHVYWTNSCGGRIGRANLDGTGVDQSFIATREPFGVAVDAAHVYWNSGGILADRGTIGRANLNGSGVDHRFIDTDVYSVDGSSITGGVGLAVDALGPPPSNRFTFARVRKNEKKGTAKLTVKVPGSGTLKLTRTESVKGARTFADVKGKATLRVKPRGRAKQKLAAQGKTKVKAEVTYTPDGGEPNTQSKKIKLVKR